MTIPQSHRHGGAAGIMITLVLILGLIGLGVWLILQEEAPRQEQEQSPPSNLVTAPDPGSSPPPAAAGEAGSRPVAPAGEQPSPIQALDAPPRLDAPATYEPENGIIEVDLSEYAGYAGLIVANGGMAPNPDSFFAKRYGFQVQLSLSEEENWGKLNNGRFAASATTADVLAVLGRQFEVTVPALIGFSRGADMVIVDRDIATVNQLAGKVLAASQFNESEFFIRYLAGEAGIPVQVLGRPGDRPKPGHLGLVFYEDAFAACDAYAHELAKERPGLNGAVGWTPRTDEVVEGSAGAAKILVSNRNLLIVADILCANKGWAEAHPEQLEGLVHGLLDGNRQLRENAEPHLATIAEAFGWTTDEARDELKLVHPANLPENRAFFDGTIDAAGSFGSIYYSSALAYGDIVTTQVGPDRFVSDRVLQKLTEAQAFPGQKVAIAPIKTGKGQTLEGDALLSKDIRFFFEPNSAELAADSEENLRYLETIKGFLQVSPGSVVLLRGHVDNARVPEFREQGGEQMVRSMALRAMELSEQRAQAVRQALTGRHPGIAADRLEAVGRGWEEPAGPDSDLNRRVEVQWFTIE